MLQPVIGQDESLNLASRQTFRLQTDGLGTHHLQLANAAFRQTWNDVEALRKLGNLKKTTAEGPNIHPNKLLYRSRVDEEKKGAGFYWLFCALCN